MKGTADKQIRNILLVEDEPAVALLTRKTLEEAGYSVEVAETGKAALDRLERSGIDLVLLDHKLPDMTGREVLGSIKQHKCDVPVIMVTGHGDEQLAADVIKAGALDYVVKSVSLDYLKTLPYVLEVAYNRFTLEAKAVRLQQQLAESEERYRKLVELSPDAIFINCVGKIAFVNGACLRLFGAESDDQLLGKAAVDMVHPDYRELSKRRIKNVLEQKGTAPLVEVKIVRLDGTIIDIDITGSFFIYEGKPSVQVIARDITERKRTEEELARHRERLEELVQEQTVDIRAAKDEAEIANKTKSEFLRNMSHELRTPLHQILGFADLGIVRGDTLSQEKQLSYFSAIQESGHQMLRLVEDLLDLSTLDTGRMDFNMQENDLMEVVKTESMKVEKQLDEHSLTLNVIPPEIKTTAKFDVDRIRQVVRNLFSNAIKFSPEGKTITVSLVMASLPTGDGSPESIPAIAMTVRDKGGGIPGDELKSIFDKFTQSSKTKTGAGGKGLGLAICKKIVAAHSGMITAENHPDGGAVIKVVLPIEPVASEHSTEG